jgi:hypothetical protein
MGAVQIKPIEVDIVVVHKEPVEFQKVYLTKPRDLDA